MITAGAHNIGIVRSRETIELDGDHTSGGVLAFTGQKIGASPGAREGAGG